MKSMLQWKSNKYYISECVSVALVIQHAKRMHVVICGLFGSQSFFHVTSKAARFSKKKFTEHKIRVLIPFTNYV